MLAVAVGLRAEGVEEALVLARRHEPPLDAELFHQADETEAVHQHADAAHEARLVHVDLVGGDRDVVAPRRGDVLEVGQRLEVRTQVLGVEPGLKPRPAEPLRLLLTTRGQERRDPGSIPVAGSRLLEREGPSLLEIPGRELGRCPRLKGGEGLLGAAGREQTGRDRRRPLRRGWFPGNR